MVVKAESNPEVFWSLHDSICSAFGLPFNFADFEVKRQSWGIEVYFFDASKSFLFSVLCRHGVFF